MFKPAGEEPKGVKLGDSEFDQGEGYLREMTAYVLDCFNNHIAEVPPTGPFSTWSANYDPEKIAPFEAEGSLQRYVPNEGDCTERGFGHLTNEDVHPVFAFDIRIANQDRHAGNFLIDKDGNLIPIDHGYTLPGGKVTNSFAV